MVEGAANPVGKLLEYLEKAVNIEPMTSTLEVWAKVLDCPADDSGTIARGIVMLLDLTDSAQRAIQEYLPGNKTLYLKPYPKIISILTNYSPFQPWQLYRSKLDAEVMTALRFGSLNLGLLYPTSDPEKSLAFSEFTERLHSLLGDCLDSDLPEDLKRLFVRHLEAIRDALIEYQLGGTADIEAVVDQAIGSMHRNAKVFEALSERGLGFVRNVFDTIAGVNELITFSQSLVLLSGPAGLAMLPLLK